MDYLGFAMFMTMLLYIDYRVWLYGGDAIFLKDKTVIEKNKRQIQLLESQLRILELQKQLKDTKSNTSEK